MRPIRSFRNIQQKPAKVPELKFRILLVELRWLRTAIFSDEVFAKEGMVMLRVLNLCILSTVVLLASGCAICQNPFDYTYDTFGGRWQRTDPCCGRVGSAFTPVGERVTDEFDEPRPAGDADQAIYKKPLDETANEYTSSKQESDIPDWKPVRDS
jgi:hypothetical protein